MFEEDRYNPNAIESDRFMSEVPISLMKENIKAQFAEPFEFRKKDHITPFITMYQYSKDNVDAFEDEDMDNVIELRDDFYSFMQKMFQDYLGIGFVDFDDMSESDQDELIHYTYRFFITNAKQNFVSLIINYINEHRDMYADEADEEKARDVTSMSFKREVTDPIDIYILSNLHSIVTEILREDIDVDTFFELCDDEGALETQFMIQKYDDLVITGNFYQKYAEMLSQDFVSHIESKVRNKILKKYRKK